MKLKLKDSRIVDVVLLSKNIPVRWFLEYINAFVDENGYLLYDRKLSFKEEKEWLDNAMKNVRKKKWIYLAALCGKQVVGTCNAMKGIGRESQNVVIGIAIAKDFRRAGLGECMLRMAISRARERLGARNIYLTVAAPNKPAIALYGKLGFKEMARFPKWLKHNEKFHDVIWMLLKNRKPESKNK